MTQENDLLKLGLEINALEDSSAPLPDASDEKEPMSEEIVEQKEYMNGEAADLKESISEEAPSVDETVPEPDTLTTISGQIRELSLSFESKLKYDAHKNKIIDDLHQDLQEYRQGLLQKYLQRIFIDVIKIIDDMRKFTAHHTNTPAQDEAVEKFLKFIVNTASDLEDLFAWEGITPYTCEGDRLDPVRQRVVDKIETDDPARARTIAARLRPGYEYEGKILRPEMVNIYVCSNNHMPNDRII
jgi:molecular chaperone GrpE (heat shock protein)